MPRPRRSFGFQPAPKTLFRPRCERLEARAMMVGDLQISLNNLFPIDESGNGWDEGESLQISLVTITENGLPATNGIDDVAWLYTFSGLNSGSLEYVVGAGTNLATADPILALDKNPNITIPWSAFASGGFDGTDLITVTLTALTSTIVEGEEVLVPIFVDGPGDTASIPLAADTSLGLLNLPPTIGNASHTAVGGGSSCEGGPTTVALTAVLGDPNSNDSVTATVNWGDGSIDLSDFDQEFEFDGSESHVYTTAGTYTITITAMDDDGEVTVTPYIVTVTGGGGTGSALLETGVLTITGSCGDDLVYVSTDGVWLNVQANFLPGPDHLATFAAADVTEIRALLGDGNDAFTVGGNIDMPMVVVGGDGNDVLMGGRAASLLIGGDGADMLFGGRGEDALIGGATIHDHDSAALGALLAEWTSSFSLPAAFVDDIIADDDSDVLHGGQDVDWLFIDAILDDALAARRDVVVTL